MEAATYDVLATTLMTIHNDFDAEVQAGVLNAVTSRSPLLENILRGAVITVGVGIIAFLIVFTVLWRNP